MDATLRSAPGSRRCSCSSRTRLRPVHADDTTTLRAILATPAVARWWHAPGRRLPVRPRGRTRGAGRSRSRTRPSSGRAGAVIGIVQAYENPDPDYDESGIDVFLAPSVHRRGLGREVVALVRDWLVDVRGHHLVTIDPAARQRGRPSPATARAASRPWGCCTGASATPTARAGTTRCSCSTSPARRRDARPRRAGSTGAGERDAPGEDGAMSLTHDRVATVDARR